MCEEGGESARRDCYSYLPTVHYTACNVTATPCRPTNMSIVPSTISCKDWRFLLENMCPDCSEMWWMLHVVFSAR